MIERLQDLFQTHVEIGQEFISFVSNMLCCLNLGAIATSGPGIIFYWFALWDPTLPSSTRKNLHWEKLRLWACQGTCIWWWKTFKNKGPKHIMCHHHRNTILMQTQTKLEHNFTPSVLELCFSCFLLIPQVWPRDHFFCWYQIAGSKFVSNLNMFFELFLGNYSNNWTTPQINLFFWSRRSPD